MELCGGDFLYRLYWLLRVEITFLYRYCLLMLSLSKKSCQPFLDQKLVTNLLALLQTMSKDDIVPLSLSRDTPSLGG